MVTSGTMKVGGTPPSVMEVIRGRGFPDQMSYSFFFTDDTVAEELSLTRTALLNNRRQEAFIDRQNHKTRSRLRRLSINEHIQLGSVCK